MKLSKWCQFLSLVQDAQELNKNGSDELRITRVCVPQGAWEEVKNGLAEETGYKLSTDRTSLKPTQESRDGFEEVFLYTATAKLREATILIFGGSSPKQREELRHLVMTALRTSGNPHISVEVAHVPSNEVVFTFALPLMMKFPSSSSGMTVKIEFPKGILIRGIFKKTFPSLIRKVSEFSESVRTGATVHFRDSRIISDHFVTVTCE